MSHQKHNAERQNGTGAHSECSFIHLFGDKILGRVLASKFCDLDGDGSHYDICRTLTNPTAHAWAFAWGMAFALSKPEWAFQVLTEFHPTWQDPEGDGQWPVQIEEAVERNPIQGYLGPNSEDS